MIQRMNLVSSSSASPGISCVDISPLNGSEKSGGITRFGAIHPKIVTRHILSSHVVAACKPLILSRSSRRPLSVLATCLCTGCWVGRIGRYQTGGVAGCRSRSDRTHVGSTRSLTRPGFSVSATKRKRGLHFCVRSNVIYSACSLMLRLVFPQRMLKTQKITTRGSSA